MISSLAQIETKNLILPVHYENIDPKQQQPVVAYRYTTRPFQLQLLVRRQQPALTGTAEHAVTIGTRKIRMHSQLDLKLAGAPKSTITLKLPPGYLLLNTVAAPELNDWSTTSAENGDLLHLELNSPQTGHVMLDLTGVIPREPGELQPSLQLPLAIAADTLRSSVAVWLDSIYSGTMSDIGTWRSVDPERLTSGLRERISQQVQFAFTSTGTQLPPIGLSLERREAKLAAAGLTTIIAKDTAIEYSLAFKWKITRAAAGTFVFTTPAWLSGKMDFQGDGYRRISESPTGVDRVRWTVELDEPRRQEFFLVANVTLPPPTDGKIVAPPIEFENETPADDGSYAPLESQTRYLILVNHSRDQLNLATADAVESTTAEAVRIINLPQSLLQQAVDILRITQPQTAVTWDVRKLEQVQSLPASVNLAENTLVVARDGSWRAQARYRINNRSRQFLALKMPADSRILSVYVAGKPSRPVETTKEGQALLLVALPKTVAGDFAFTADIVYAGQLPAALPQGNQATGLNFDLPHADVVSPKEDERFGIPVSKTSWTVYLPDDVDASVIDDPGRTNLKVVPVSLQEYAYKDTLLREAKDLLSISSRIESSAGKKRLRYNLEQLQRQQANLSRLESNSNTDVENEKQAELQRRNADLQKSIRDAYEKLGEEPEDRKSDGFKDLTYHINDSRSEEYRQQRRKLEGKFNSNRAISSELSRGNEIEAKTEVDGAVLPQLEIADSNVTKSGKAASAQQRRSRLNEQAMAQQKELVKKVQSEKRMSGRVMVGAGINTDDGEVTDRVREIFGLDQNGGNAAGRGEEAQLQAILEGQNAQNNFFEAEPENEEMGLRQQAQQQEADTDFAQQQWTEAGGLSLLIDVPTAGQKLTFTKVGGAPKLAVTLRPQQFRDTIFDTAWLLIWGGLGLSVVLALRRPAAAAALLRLAPVALMVFGGVWYFLFPYAASLGFIILMLGAVWFAVRHRHVAA